MSAPPRHRLALDERRAQLLALGLRLFAERSYDEVSIDDIADEAGVSKGLLYHYFGSKRAFYVATVREAASTLQHRTEPDLSLPPAERARSGLESYVAFVEEHAKAYAALMRSGVGNDPEVAAVVEETRDAIVARMLREMGFAEPRPAFRFVLRGWIGMVEATSLDWLERRDVERDVLIRVLLESLYASVMIAMRIDPESGFVPEVDPMTALATAAAPSSTTTRPEPPKKKNERAPTRAKKR